MSSPPSVMSSTSSIDSDSAFFLRILSKISEFSLIICRKREIITHCDHDLTSPVTCSALALCASAHFRLWSRYSTAREDVGVSKGSSGLSCKNVNIQKISGRDFQFSMLSVTAFSTLAVSPSSSLMVSSDGIAEAVTAVASGSRGMSFGVN